MVLRRRQMNQSLGVVLGNAAFGVAVVFQWFEQLLETPTPPISVPRISPPPHLVQFLAHVHQGRHRSWLNHVDSCHPRGDPDGVPDT